MYRQHAAAAAHGFVDLGRNRKSRFAGNRRFANHRPLAGQFPFAAEPLVRGRVERGFVVGFELPGEVTLSRPGATILAKLGPDFLRLFAHAFSFQIVEPQKVAEISL